MARGAAAACTGDCDGDGAVRINELITGVGIALGEISPEQCGGFEPPVGINQIVTAVGHAVNGCPGSACALPGGEFDDHTKLCLADRAQFFELAVGGQSRSVVKFVITDFESPAQRQTRFQNGLFYDLHDEWYWFRLLNGVPVPGDSVLPVAGLHFDTIDEIYEWARRVFPLPLDLQFGGDGRLFSTRFYLLGLRDPRSYGLGGLVHLAAREDPPRAERWLFQLEYIDILFYDQLVTFFEALEEALPEEIGSTLAWLVRSPEQEAMARQIEAQGLPYSDRIVRFSELAVPGEIEVYSSGLAAGRLRLAPAEEGGLTTVLPTEIAVVDLVPDFLPPLAALITAVPQTPLAHVNLLARNRGIPNVYLGGVFDDPVYIELSLLRAPVAMRAREPDQLEVVTLTDNEYTTWLGLQRLATVAVPQVDLSTAPYVLDVGGLDLAGVEELRPFIGGKSAGFLALQAVPDMVFPDRPLAITIRAYAEHLAGFDADIDAMLADSFFSSSTQLRYLVLEGRFDYDERYRSTEDRSLAERFLDLHPEGNLVGDLVRQGGLKAAIRERPIVAATLATLRSTLETQFAGYAVTQGLRFRSSSTVEDIEGFTGAGLYDSNTGFLDAAAQESDSDRRRTIEWALKKTWASYWSAEAFEERRLAAIDHRSGNMGVLVHARFDDALELANGVITFTLLPEGFDDEGVMEVNAQLGAVSVTNPDPGSSALPEVDRVSQAVGETGLSIDRVRPSTLVAKGEQVLDDAMLADLFADTRAVAEVWLAQENSGRGAAQTARMATLDFEFRYMAAGWPALAAGPPFERRMVVKQARSLEPGVRGVGPEVLAAPVPRHILGRVRRVERYSCAAPGFLLRIFEVYSDPLVAPDLGFSSIPFTAEVIVSFNGDVPELGAQSGDEVILTHLDLAGVEHPGLADRGTWSIEVDVAEPRASQEGLSEIDFSFSGRFRLAHEGAEFSGNGGFCTRTVPYFTPADFLEEILEERS